jgi:hypothetical protein
MGDTIQHLPVGKILVGYGESDDVPVWFDREGHNGCFSRGFGVGSIIEGDHQACGRFDRDYSSGHMGLIPDPSTR